jgi:hypothetical protein
MDAKDLDYVKDTVQTEGFDYAFRHYSDFANIKDTLFHELRKAYVDAAEALIRYLNIEE